MGENLTQHPEEHNRLIQNSSTQASFCEARYEYTKSISIGVQVVRFRVLA